MYSTFRLTGTLRLTKSIHTAGSLRTFRSPQPISSIQALRSLHPSKPMMTSSLLRPGLGQILAGDFKRRLSSSSRYRDYRAPDYSPNSDINMKILWGLIGVNCGVWGYFMYVRAQANQGYMKGITSFVPNFTINMHEFFGQRRYWQAITAAFTHFDPIHLLFNMVSAYTLGQFVAKTPGIGPSKFLTLVFGSALAGSLGFLAQRFSKYEKGNVDPTRGLGFSGCVMGMGAAAACLYPHAQLLVMGIIPAPLWALSIGYLVYDGYYLTDNNTRTGHAGHLGGAFFGVAYYMLKLRGLRV